MLRKARSFVYQIVGRFIGRLLVLPRPDQRRVLLACHNSMMATYLSEIHDLVKNDPRIVVRTSIKTPEEVEGDIELSKSLLGCRHLSTRISKLLPWDLVIMANHPRVFNDVLKSARKVLRIPHGIGSKRVDGVDYMYNKSCFDVGGELIYSRFFESSFDRRDSTIAQNPQFNGKISVVGSIRLDRIAARRRSQAKPPRRTAKKVLVVSSWGEGNLFDYLQRSNFSRTARDLSEEFTFKLRPHPNLRSSVNPDSNAFGNQLAEWEQLENIEVSTPGEELESDLAACDLLFGDDLTSVSLFGVALDLPIVLWKTCHPGVGEGTYLHCLSTILPCIDPNEDLGNLLRRSLEESHSPARQELANNLRSYPNEAERRARAEIYELLELPDPPKYRQS